MVTSSVNYNGGEILNTYLIPQEMKDEMRFLIFSKESLIFTLIGIVVGAIVYMPFYLLAMFASVFNIIGFVLWGIITLIAWALGTFKIPEMNAFEILKKTGGESVYEILKRVRKFRKSRKIYC